MAGHTAALAATQRESCDVAVIGGGPAGSAAALRLAQQGLHVIQLERRVFHAPANDPFRSGEALLPSTIRELQQIGIHDGESWALGCVQQLFVRWRNGRSTQDHFPDHSLLRLIHREQFDHALFCAALQSGVDGRQEWHVRELTMDSAGVCNGLLAADASGTLTHIRAKLVIDAGGRNARSITQFGLRETTAGPRFMAIVLYVDVLPELDPDRWEMHFWGDTELAVMQITQIEPGLVRCGLGVNAHAKQRAKAIRPEAFFWQRIADNPPLERRLRGSRQIRPFYSRSDLGYRVKHMALPGLLLIGDASGYLNPILGDGIWAALRSAAIASEVAYDAWREHDFSQPRLGEYERRWETQRRTRWLVARMLLQGYEHPRLLAAPAYFPPIRRLLLHSLLHT